MSDKDKDKSAIVKNFAIGAAISISVIGGYVYYKKYSSQQGNKNKEESKKFIKLKCNFKCLTLELSKTNNVNIPIDYKSRLKPTEIENIKTRKDKTQFLTYCSNCLECGHNITNCNKRYKICVAGDSHTAFWGCAARYYINTDVVRIRISGMSAQGLINKNSHLKSSQKIINAFKNCHKGKSGLLFIQIGQVDIDYVWYYRQMKYKNTLKFEDQIEKSINNLFSFLIDNELLNENGNTKTDLNNVQIIIHGVHLPPLNNNNMKQKLYGHFINRSELTKEYLDQYLKLPSHQERTKMAMRFNEILMNKCKEFECLFVQVSSEIIDEKTGIVQEKYIKKDEIDIHLDPKSLIPIYHKKFKEMKLDFALEIEEIWRKLPIFKHDLRERFQT